MDTTQTLTQVEWYTKQEAGARLGTIEHPMSTRRVLELAKAGKFQSERFPDLKTGQMTVLIHAGSLERYLDSRGPQQRPGLTPPQTTPATTWTASDALTKRLGELVQLANLLRSGPGPKESDQANQSRMGLWLTLPQAEVYSGLPAPILLGFIKAGKLPAMDVGRRRGGRWRIRRVDLERIEAPGLGHVLEGL